MSLQLTHEAEQSRQHARYKIPVTIIRDGNAYQAVDWSVSGFALDNFPSQFLDNGILNVRLIFRFDGFETAMDLEAEIIWTDSETTRTGFRFVHMDSGQLSLLHYVIDACLSGEVVAAGDLLNVVRRDNFSTNTRNQKAEAEQNASRKMKSVKKFVGFCLMLTLFSGLIFLVASTVYKRLYLVEGVAGVVDAPIIVVRAPQPSYLNLLNIQADNEVTTGQSIAAMKLVGGGAVTIESPCQCRILRIHSLEKQFVDQGEPLLTLLPSGNQPYINSEIGLEAMAKMKLGDPAKIRLVNGEEYQGKIKQIMLGETLERRHTAVLNPAASNTMSMGKVVIETEKPIDIQFIGMPAVVAINTTRSPFEFSR